jgi:hypothetical protein
MQNSVALQYVSYLTATNPYGDAYAQQKFTYPNDVLWVTALTSPWNCSFSSSCGTFQSSWVSALIPDPQGLAAMVTFADQAWPGLAPVTGLQAWVNLLPIAAGHTADMLTSTLSDYLPWTYSIYNTGFYQDNEFPPTAASLSQDGGACVSTFLSPCPYYQQTNAPTAYLVTNHIYPITNFFK